MIKYELLLKLRAIIDELEHRQDLIKHWISSGDSDLALLGKYQQEVVNRQHTLLLDLMTEAQRDGLSNE